MMIDFSLFNNEAKNYFNSLPVYLQNEVKTISDSILDKEDLIEIVGKLVSNPGMHFTSSKIDNI